MTPTPTLAEAIAVVREIADTEAAWSARHVETPRAQKRKWVALRTVADLAERTVKAEAENNRPGPFIDHRQLAYESRINALAAENARLRAALTELEALVVPLAVFFDIAARASFDGCDYDGLTIQDDGLRLGLLDSEPYNPDIHGYGEECDPGEPWYTVKDAIAATVALANTHEGDAG